MIDLESAGKSTLSSSYCWLHFPSSLGWSAHRFRFPASEDPEVHSVRVTNRCGSCFIDRETALDSGQTLDLAGPGITTVLVALGWRGEADVHGSRTASVLIREEGRGDRPAALPSS